MRLIRSGALAPAWNLALDEALLRTGRETFRLYAWDPPGLSLGYFQKAAAFSPPRGYEIVRRPTGGGAIAHVGELTLSWVGRRRRVEEAYASINAIVAQAVERLGICVSTGAGAPKAAPAGLCFDAATRYDLMAKGRKFFGSAQRRSGGRFLLHGSLVLDPNPLARGAVSLRELAGRAVTRQEAELLVVAAAREVLGVALFAESPTAEEWRLAGRLVLERYAAWSWTRKR